MTADLNFVLQIILRLLFLLTVVLVVTRIIYRKLRVELNSRNGSASFNKTRFISVGLIVLGIFLLIPKDSWGIKYLSKYERFHPHIAPESNFFPSVFEILHTITSSDPDRIDTHVIIGGSSGLYGVGQSVSQTTSYLIRSQLGKEYKVWNLAFRGGNAGGQGYVITEALLKKGYRVIYLADAQPGGVNPLNAVNAYQYFYWQANYGNLLYRWPQREELIKDLSFVTREAKLQGFLDAKLRFTPLFNFITFNILSPLPNPYAELQSKFSARKVFEDSEISAPLLASYVTRPDVEGEVAIWKGSASQVISESDWEIISMNWSQTFPPNLRDHTMIYIAMDASGIRNMTDPSFTTKRIQIRARFSSVLESIGIEAHLITDDWPANYFVDRSHWSSLGAREAAKQMSDDIINKARKLGYVN